MPRNDVSFQVNSRDVSNSLNGIMRQLPNLLQNVVLMRSLNRAGDMARTRLVRELAEAAGTKQRDVKTGVIAHRATESVPEYELVVQGEWLTGMVNVVTLGDEKVCPICIEAERRGPYRFDEIHVPIHPNCRCSLIPVERYIRQQLTGHGDIAVAVQDTINENLPRIFQEELGFALDKLRRDVESLRR